MTEGARERILARVRAGIGAPVERVAKPGSSRTAGLDSGKLVELFVAQATAAHVTLEQLGELAEVPGRVGAYLARHNLAARVVTAPDPLIEALAWAREPLIERRRGRAEEDDRVSVTGAFAGIAETGTLLFLSGPEHPPTLHLRPDHHIVVLPTARIAATPEDAWRRLDQPMPRTATFVTGPSRTGDIEQRMQLGAHGPRQLHILLVR